NNPNGCQIEGGTAGTATILNSVCKADGSGAAVSASDITNEFLTATLRNVTAVSVSGQGLLSSDAMPASRKSSVINAVNTIARGGTFDVQAGHSSDGAANVNLSYSNYSSTHTNDIHAVITDQGHNQSAPPLLTSDFHEMPGSPTIDAGLNDPAN